MKNQLIIIAALLAAITLLTGCATTNSRVIDLTNQRADPSPRQVTETKPDGTTRTTIYNFTR
jgi:uncharacterized lipoprotein YajG